MQIEESKAEKISSMPPSMLVSATYENISRSAILKFYEPKSQKLILWKDEKKIVVQCKGHKKPIGVSVIRDLYGAMMHFEANSAILACPAGFTIGVKKFATDKPIQLISATDLVEMVESFGNR